MKEENLDASLTKELFENTNYKQISNKKKTNKKIILIAALIYVFVVLSIIIGVFLPKNTNHMTSIDAKIKLEETKKFTKKEVKEYKVITQNNFLFFDPITTKPCNETNYWTPFYKDTTCYRFVSIQTSDSETSPTITLMLDHNIAYTNFSNYKNVLKEKTSQWIRQNGDADIIDEPTIFNLMKFNSTYPTEDKVLYPVNPFYHYCMNSYYVINGVTTQENGYFTKTMKNNKVYAITSTGGNYLESTSRFLGVRPVINVNKDLLKLNSPEINIDKILDEGTAYHYMHEKNVSYEGFIYRQLQSFTITNDKLAYHLANNANPAKGIVYTVLLSDMKNFYSRHYDYTAHGNGMCFNPKKNKAMIAGPDFYNDVWELNGETLEHEKTYFGKEGCRKMVAIGYDKQTDTYYGANRRQIFNFDTDTLKKTFNNFDIGFWETDQDIEVHNGYLFQVVTDGGLSRYQNYTFHNKGDGIVYVYNVKVDRFGKPTKDYGRFVCTLIMTKKGEIEAVDFHDKDMYFGFASYPVSKEHSISFYKVDYKVLTEYVKKKAIENGGQYFD